MGSLLPTSAWCLLSAYSLRQLPLIRLKIRDPYCRDQESAKSRLVPPGSDDQNILQSSSHSLFGHPALLGSKYDQEHELGRGGNAIIYQVKCRETGKQYACKTIKKVSI